MSSLELSIGTVGRGGDAPSWSAGHGHGQPGDSVAARILDRERPSATESIAVASRGERVADISEVFRGGRMIVEAHVGDVGHGAKCGGAARVGHDDRESVSIVRRSRIRHRGCHCEVG